MAKTADDPILQMIRSLAEDHPLKNVPDQELLRRFTSEQDQAAFAGLVRRHGSMVLGVCRAVLRHRQDAEDAFQATFLVLACKASSIRQRAGLGSWLHGVAYRVACKAQAAGLRRQEIEANAPVPPPVLPADDLSWGEVRAVLHAELNALPERFRQPLVLCYLEGLTQDEAARRLGWTAATVKGRLQRGRDVLGRRLERTRGRLGGVAGGDNVNRPGIGRPGAVGTGGNDIANGPARCGALGSHCGSHPGSRRARPARAGQVSGDRGRDSRWRRFGGRRLPGTAADGE